MDPAKAALYPVAAVEEATHQSQEDDRAWDREAKSLCLSLQWPGSLVEFSSITYECFGSYQVAYSAGTCESTLPTSALHAPFVNRRMPNGTYGGVRGGGRKAPTYSILLTLIDHTCLQILLRQVTVWLNIPQEDIPERTKAISPGDPLGYVQ